MDWEQDLSQTFETGCLMVLWAGAGFFFMTSFHLYMIKDSYDFYFSMLMTLYFTTGFMYAFILYRQKQELFNTLYDIGEITW